MSLFINMDLSLENKAATSFMSLINLLVCKHLNNDIDLFGSLRSFVTNKTIRFGSIEQINATSSVTIRFFFFFFEPKIFLIFVNMMNFLAVVHDDK